MKNIRQFKGKPMLQWPIEAAKASGLFDRLIVSTDDLRIAKVAWGCGSGCMKRDRDDGSVGTQEIAARVLEAFPDVAEACVIYPCSPMLTPTDLVQAHEWLQPGRFVVSWCNGADAGCYYWGYANDFRRRLPLPGNDTQFAVDSSRFIDINTPEDWARAESMFDRLHP